MDNIKMYSMLTEEEVEVFRKMSLEQLKKEIKEFEKKTKIDVKDFSELETDSLLYVHDGDWYGTVTEEESGKVLRTFEDSSPDNVIREIRLDESIANIGLTITYLADMRELSDMQKILFDRTNPYLKSNGCVHEVVSGDNYSRIKCIHCGEWYYS